MALKAILDSLDGLSDELKKLYVQKDGKFHLDVEGVVPKDRLDEFRNNNIELKKQLDEITGKYKDIDPEQVRELLKQDKALKEKKLLDAGKVEELLEERTKAMKADYDTKIKALTEKDEKATSQLERLLVDNTIQAEAVKAGVRETAMEDVLLRGRSRYKVQDGKAVPVSPDGKIIYGKDGTSPESMTEWLGGLSSAAPHLFNPSTGGGANGSGGKGGAKAMSRKDFEALGPTEKMVAAQAMGKKELVVTD